MQSGASVKPTNWPAQQYQSVLKWTTGQMACSQYKLFSVLWRRSLCFHGNGNALLSPSDRPGRGLVGSVSNMRMRIYCPSAPQPQRCSLTWSCDWLTSCQPHSNPHNMFIINLGINLDFGNPSTYTYGPCWFTHTYTHKHTSAAQTCTAPLVKPNKNECMFTA